VIMGWARAGSLGIILAAPVAAALKLLGGYVWRKLLLLPPFPEEPEAPHERAPSMLGRTLARLISRRGTVPEQTATVLPPDHNQEQAPTVLPPSHEDDTTDNVPPPAAKA
jgi:hypothetical protein